MAVTKVKKRSDTTRIDANGSQHTVIYLVECDSRTDGSAVAAAANDGTTAIPSIGTAHSSSDGSKVTSIDARNVTDSDYHFEVTVQYGVESTQQSSGGDPLEQPAQISYGGQTELESYTQDESDPPKPVANSAGDRFESDPQRERTHLTLNIVTNESSFNPATMLEYCDTTNSSAVTIDGTTYAAGTLKMGAITATRQINGSTTYYQVTKPIKASHSGWEDEFLDVGYNVKNTAANPNDKQKQTKPILDAANQRLDKPAPLDGSGQLADTTASSYTPATLTFKPYKAKDWSSLKWS